MIFVKPNNEVWYHCHSSTSHKFFQGKKIGCLDNDHKIEFTDVDGQKSLEPPGVFTGSNPENEQIWHQETKIFEYLNDIKLVQEIKHKLGTRCICMKAGMSLGKTFQLKKFIDALGKDVRKLIVSTRISFAASQLGLFQDFYSYKDNVWHADRLICQYESLHHLEGQKTFDYVFLDETVKYDLHDDKSRCQITIKCKHAEESIKECSINNLLGC